MKKIAYLFLLVASIFTVQCSSSKKTATMDTAATSLNGSWELNYITGPRIAFEGLYPRKKPILMFNLPSMEANGHTSCNSFSSNITLKGNAISFGDGRATLMACEGEGEAVFLTTLKKITSYSVNDNVLTLIMGDIAMMRFVKK